MDIIDKLDLISMDNLDEMFKKVIRFGKIKRKKICPPGMKAVDGKCKMMSPSEKMKRKKAAIKRGKQLKANVGTQKKAMRKRAKSLRKRAMQIPDQGAPTMKTTNDKEGKI
jgi:phage-related tail protein